MARQAVRFGSLFSTKALEEADVRAILEMTC